MSEHDPIQTYYEEYWSDPEAAAPVLDPSRTTRLRMLAKEIRTFRPSRIVDAGCGSGWTLRSVRQPGQAGIGLDISAAATGEARRLDPDGQYYQVILDGERWPLDDGAVDLIYSFEVIEHLMGVSHFLREAHRCLAPHGHVVLTTPYHGLIKNFAIVAFSFDKHFAVDGPHIRFFSLRSLNAALRQTGFVVTSTRFYGRIRPLAAGMYVVARRLDT